MNILRSVPGQPEAIWFLEKAAARPHHAYLFAGPEGSGKQQAARAFAGALLCPRGGCGECRDCRLALADRHPNLVVVEPEGRDIRVGLGPDDHGTARWMVAWASRTAPEPGWKVFRVEQADRMTPEAADVLLKALEEPTGGTVFILSSARPDELPETVRSRCQTVTFHPLAEAFVVDTLVNEGAPEERALLATRVAGGNLGRARRIAADDRGLAFREAALEALDEAGRGPAGALAAADRLMEAAKEYQKGLGRDLEAALEPFTDPETGAPVRQFRAEIRRLEERHVRRERRAERDFLDWSLLALEAVFRDSLLSAAGGDRDWSINLDLDGGRLSARDAARAVEVLEEAREALADETNLNVRLILEEAFLRLTDVAPAVASA
ncbi:MAG TPA: DNA polymerase III subunit [Actinomycetota bacterium]|jgi:DNA polymerase-3 subunit delta'|nr:DNA polymerase III subunit [Actinomycetota bacterium]